MKIVLIFISLSLIFSVSVAEDVRGMEAKFIFGASAFLDEEIPFDHSIFGGSIPIHLTDRLSIEPQLLYMKGPGSDRDLTVMGNVAYEFYKKDRFAIYVVGGAGILRNTQQFGSSEFTAEEFTGSGGVGAKLFLTKRLFVAPEFRFGWEPLFTATTAIGFQF